MKQKIWRIVGLGILVFFCVGCAASHLDEAKRQYELAMISDSPLPYYKAALEELDAVIARDSTQYQAYALKGLIYRNLEDFERATENLEIAKKGSYGGTQSWVPMMMNVTYGDIFHARATEAIRSNDWEVAKSYQGTSIEFFNSVVNASFDNIGMASTGNGLGITMQDLYLVAQGRWAAAKFQMAVIAGRLESKERQDELLREVTTRLGSIIETYPEATFLRYYLADGYRKQSLTLRRVDPDESQQLQEQAMAQLRVCAEIGLPTELRNAAVQLFNALSSGAEPEIEQKILATIPTR
ncbi:MAG: hypothetical protein RBT80_19465 [Candidatus Vecturithrix sp.]|jgi:tetratricopeptide (TPR) repeat protein|nr:hypothetical protein [Candidatus Vecturithrix sp.]